MSVTNILQPDGGSHATAHIGPQLGERSSTEHHTAHGDERHNDVPVPHSKTGLQAGAIRGFAHGAQGKPARRAQLAAGL